MIEKLKDVLFWILDVLSKMTTSEWISFISLIIAVIGGFFALHKWKETIINKRSVIVRELIEKVRDDNQISAVMDIIDWDEGFEYDGKFTFFDSNRIALKNTDDASLFLMIDKTLSHFSYICYLQKKKLLKKADIKIFDYELRRLLDNEHIANYLFSLYHWSKHLKVNMSYIYLVKYGIRKRYLKFDFYKKNSRNYICYLDF